METPTPPVQPVLTEGVYHSVLDTVDKQPVSLVLPKAYEPAYSYPLLVFLHGHGESENQWLDALPSLSQRNYIGLSLRGPTKVRRRDGVPGYGWGGGRRCDSVLEDYVLTAVAETVDVCNIHPDRIFLVGACEGGSVAYRLALSFPEKFAGAVVLNGWLPSGPLPLARHRRGAPGPIFIGQGVRNRSVAPARAVEAQHLLYSAGLDVELRTYQAGHETT
ncbi:MAG: alpha/beta hydrolase, partial [Planctomycetia bacterium]